MHRPIREQLAESFSAEAEFYLYKDLPYVVYPDSDHAERWDVDPPMLSHPFAPVLSGQRISENEFRALVRRHHGLTRPGQPAHTISEMPFDN